MAQASSDESLAACGYLPIAEHGLIGDMQSVALVGSDGTIDWYCCPSFDAPSVFAAILDAERGGCFELAADAPATTKQFYFPDTNVLITRFFTEDGVGEVQDFMPVTDEPADAGRHRVIRRVVCVRGSVAFRVRVAPRFGYAAQPHTVQPGNAVVVFESADLSLALTATVPPERADQERAPTKRRTDMGKIVISENVSLDGVVQDPTGDEGFRVGGWVGRVGDRGREEAAKVLLDEALGTRALLLGRRSYEFFATRWPSRSGELADRLNSLPKYVVSSTLEDPVWNNSAVLKGDVVSEVSKLKQELDGDIVVYASFQLVHTLMEHDLVDELRLMVYPVVLGAGERLFGETSDKKSMRLVNTRTVEGGLAYLTYELVRDA
jgi:dihydrofolate reductase